MIIEMDLPELPPNYIWTFEWDEYGSVSMAAVDDTPDQKVGIGFKVTRGFLEDVYSQKEAIAMVLNEIKCRIENRK